MKILNIELKNVDHTELGFEHWVDVTYKAPVLNNEYTVKLLLLMAFEIEDQLVLDYMIKEWRYRDLVRHSVLMYEMEHSENFSISHWGKRRGSKITEAVVSLPVLLLCILISLQTGINTGDMKEVENIFHNVLKKANLSLRSDDYTFFELNNVKDTALRSVMIQTIFKAREHEIEILFEVKDEIERLPMNLLDLVRVASVLLNNAVEGAAESTSKSINISLVNLENEIIFVIQNSRQSRHMNIEEIYEMGFSTKGKNRGLGLSNVKEIISKYEDIILETDITSNSFTQVLIFKRKEILWES